MALRSRHNAPRATPATFARSEEQRADRYACHEDGTSVLGTSGGAGNEPSTTSIHRAETTDGVVNMRNRAVAAVVVLAALGAASRFEAAGAAPQE
ncbi:hypothetical protein ACFVW2_22755 [Streptomyces sp. NPDC058171]